MSSASASSPSAIGCGSSSTAAVAADVGQPQQQPQQPYAPHRSALVVQSLSGRERRYSESMSSALALTANLYTDKVVDNERQTTRIRHSAVDSVAAADMTAKTMATTRVVHDAINERPRRPSTSSASTAVTNGHSATFGDKEDVGDSDWITMKTSAGSQQSSSVCAHRGNGHVEDEESIDRTSSMASLMDKKTQSSDCLRTLTESYRSMLLAVGEDPTREGLLKTPERAAMAMMYFTKGYEESVAGKCKNSRAVTEFCVPEYTVCVRTPFVFQG